MTVFESIKSKDIDELVKWIDKHTTIDNSPYITWWDNNYCNKCMVEIKDGHEYGWCELHNKCKYFQDMDSIPSCEQVIKMWLESEDVDGV